MCALAATPAANEFSTAILCEMALLLYSVNRLLESEKMFLEGLEVVTCMFTRARCMQNLGRISIQRREWSKSIKYLEDGLKLLLEVPEADCEPRDNLIFQVQFLGLLGDALEGQGEWARARQYDKQAVAIWSQLERPHSEVMGALRRTAMDFI